MSFKNLSNLELWRPLCSSEQNHLYNFGRRHHHQQFSKIILNLDQRFRRKCCLKIFLSRALAAPLFSNIGRGYYEEQFCEIISNLGQWFRRCRLKDFLSRALVALLFGGAMPFMQFWKRASCGTFM